jgi:hypothetical protein
MLGCAGLLLLAAAVPLARRHGLRLVNVGDRPFAHSERRGFESLKKEPFSNDLGDAHVEADSR